MQGSCLSITLLRRPYNKTQMLNALKNNFSEKKEKFGYFLKFRAFSDSIDELVTIPDENLSHAINFIVFRLTKEFALKRDQEL